MNDLPKMKVGAWEWSVWPTLPIPDDGWLVRVGQAKGPSAINDYWKEREVNIERERFDPLTYGWEQPFLKVIRALLKGDYKPGMIGVSLVNGKVSAGAQGGSPSPRPSPPGEGVTDTAVGTAGAMGGGGAAGGWCQARPANDVVCLGGNGSGKTDVQARIAMEILESRPGSEARCFSQNEQTSIQYIQKALFRYLRPDLRRIKSQGLVTKISYKAGTGFSEGKFILPSGATALFPTYKAFQQDPNSVEGGECDIVTWDEQAPADLLETVRFRAHKKGGFVLGGFTPVLGYSETVGQYIEGGRIIEAVPARKVVWDWWRRTWTWGEWMLPPDRVLVKGCPPGHVPLVIQSGQGGGRRFAVICPTPFNPYTNVEAIIAGMDAALDKQIEFKLERLWGWPTKKARPSFPKFGEHHVVKERVGYVSAGAQGGSPSPRPSPPGEGEDLARPVESWGAGFDPELMEGIARLAGQPIKKYNVPDPKDLTIYWWGDPHGDRNWFMLWLGVDRDGRKYVLKEWPDREMGEWAVPGAKPDGKMGTAQTMGHGKSFNDYKRLVLSMEGWITTPEGIWRPGPQAWTVYDRRIDPRPAETSVPSDEEARTYLDHLNDPVLSTDGRTVLIPGLDVMAGNDCSIEEGKQWVNNLLTEGWNPDEPVTPLNCPRFYVLEECENLIWALKTWTGADGLKGACKDPIDCLKGLGKMGITFVERGAMGSYGGGSY